MKISNIGLNIVLKLALTLSLAMVAAQPSFAKTNASANTLTNDTVVQEVSIQGVKVRFEKNPSLDEQARTAISQTYNLLKTKQYDKALATIQPVIDNYQQKYANIAIPVYSSRTAEQAQAITQFSIEKNDKALVILHGEWVTALYLKGFILVEKNQLSQALKTYHQALERSPFNAQVANEIGHIFQAQRDWQTASETFELASQFSEFSPTDSKNAEYTRALRGMAFSATEQGNYTQAKKLYQQCLKINPNDTIARQELQYVQSKNKP